MSCNSADLHSCAFQDRLWMNEWRECWTDANFSGSARIEGRRVGRGRAAASDAPKKIYSPFFTHFVYSGDSFSVICSLFTCFLTLSVASFSPLCQLSPPPWQQCFHWMLQKSKQSVPSWVLIWCFKVISFSCFRSRKISNQQQSFKAHCLYLIQAGTSHWDLKRLLFLLLCFNMCLIFMSSGFISFCCHRRGVEEPDNSKTKVMPKNSCWRTHFTFYYGTAC